MLFEDARMCMCVLTTVITKEEDGGEAKKKVTGRMMKWGGTEEEYIYISLCVQKTFPRYNRESSAVKLSAPAWIEYASCKGVLLTFH